jgi:hypothetical protein
MLQKGGHSRVWRFFLVGYVSMQLLAWSAVPAEMLASSNETLEDS